MNKVVFLTAYNRVPYLQETLFSWDQVRGTEDWHFVAMIEPSEFTKQIVDEFYEFSRRTKWKTFNIHVNPKVYGVLHTPWVGFDGLFKEGADFVVRAEDDLTVADDILEFFDYAIEEFKDRPDVATVHAFSEAEGDEEEVALAPQFSPWVWGTWKDKWELFFRDTWDHDYSTHNGTPGVQAGWDWNINTRIFPRFQLKSAVPVLSRSNNIGVHGVHGTAENFVHHADLPMSHPQHAWH